MKFGVGKPAPAVCLVLHQYPSYFVNNVAKLTKYTYLIMLQMLQLAVSAGKETGIRRCLCDAAASLRETATIALPGYRPAKYANSFAVRCDSRLRNVPCQHCLSFANILTTSFTSSV